MGHPKGAYSNGYTDISKHPKIYLIQNPYVKQITLLFRFIDYIFTVWAGTSVGFEDFQTSIQNNDLNIKFTFNYGETKVEFFDACVEIKNGEVVTMGHCKLHCYQFPFAL